MTQREVNNAKVLYRLAVPRSEVERAHDIFTKTPVLLKMLDNPVVREQDKEAVLGKLAARERLPKLLENFMKMMCRIGEIAHITDIFDCYYDYWDEKHGILRAEITYANEAERESEAAIRAQIGQSYPGSEIVIEDKIDDALLGGYIIRINNEEYDYSYEGKLRRLERKLTGR